MRRGSPSCEENATNLAGFRERLDLYFVAPNKLLGLRYDIPCEDSQVGAQVNKATRNEYENG